MEKIEIKVTKTNISLTNGYVLNQGEYQVDKCKFTFTEDYNGLVKKAVFVDGDTSIDMVILNNECDIPYEILQTSNEFVLKVYGYEVDNEELKLRYSPTALKMFLREGSYVGSNEVITPTRFEQYEQALHDGLEEVANVDIDAAKVGNTATITITNRYGVEKSVQILDGEQGEQGVPGPAGQDGADAKINGVNTLTLAAGENITLNQSGNTLTISSQGGSGAVTSVNGQTGDVTIDVPDVSNFITKDVNNLTNYYKKTETYTQNEIDSKLSSVYKYKGTVSTYADLPSTGLTVGDVYNIETADSQHGIEAGDNVAWNGTSWDVLAGTVDLSGYQTKIDSSHKLSSNLVDDTGATNLFVTSSEKSTWNAKYDLPSGGIPSTDLSSAVQTSLGKADTAIQDISGKLDVSKVKNTTSTTSGDVYDVTYINTMLGDIETLLGGI